MNDIALYKKNVHRTVFGNYGCIITHAFAQHYNFGDYALAYGVQNIFTKYLTPYARFVSSDVHTTIYDKKQIEHVNAISDIFLIGGGGLIQTWDNPFWLFNMSTDDIKYLKVPMVFYGLGYNNFANTPLSPEAVENIKALSNAAISFSVRNDGSKERLSTLGLDFPEVPDPGFFVDGNHPRPNIKRQYVMVQLAYDSQKERQTDTNAFINNILKICEFLLKKHYHVILAPHCYPDIDISKQILDTINNKYCTMWDWFEIIKENNTIVGLGYYKYADFVIAMRGHAQICPIGMNVPVVSIINHPKHLGILKTLNLEQYAVMVNEPHFSDRVIEIIETIKISLHIDNKYLKFLSLGIGLSLFTQVAINISVVIGLLPVTGITLPILSYGGSSLVLTLIFFGIILNISQYTEEVK